jgi:hypothetical protein
MTVNAELMDDTFELIRFLLAKARKIKKEKNKRPAAPSATASAKKRLAAATNESNNVEAAGEQEVNLIHPHGWPCECISLPNKLKSIQYKLQSQHNEQMISTNNSAANGLLDVDEMSDLDEQFSNDPIKVEQIYNSNSGQPPQIIVKSNIPCNPLPDIKIYSNASNSNSVKPALPLYSASNTGPNDDLVLIIEKIYQGIAAKQMIPTEEEHSQPYHIELPINILTKIEECVTPLLTDLLLDLNHLAPKFHGDRITGRNRFKRENPYHNHFKSGEYSAAQSAAWPLNVIERDYNNISSNYDINARIIERTKARLTHLAPIRFRELEEKNERPGSTQQHKQADESAAVGAAEAEQKPEGNEEESSNAAVE